MLQNIPLEEPNEQRHIISNRRGFAPVSKGQRNIAKYILENYDKAAFMTASKLGKTVNVSESTVVRFAGRAGLQRISGNAQGASGHDTQLPYIGAEN